MKIALWRSKWVVSCFLLAHVLFLPVIIHESAQFSACLELVLMAGVVYTLYQLLALGCLGGGVGMRMVQHLRTIFDILTLVSVAISERRASQNGLF